jgi:hypothetical protein
MYITDPQNLDTLPIDKERARGIKVPLSHLNTDSGM